MATDRILTTHVGSLIRPTELTDFLLKQQNGESIDETAYEECLRRSVVDVVKMQAEIGIDIISDGEFGKNLSWSRYILERLNGFEQRHGGGVGSVRATTGKDRRDFAEFYAEYEATHGFVGMGRSFAKTGLWYVTGPVSYAGQAAIQRDIDDFKAALRSVKVEDAFLPVVAPASVAPERGEEYYKSAEDSLMAIARALREEYKAIIDAGLTVQIDDAFLATYYDVMVPPGTFADYRKWAEFRLDATNEAIKGLPPERIRYHVCWGSWNGPHTNDVPAKDIMDLVLKLNVGAISLEMANPRHEHEWRIWETIKLPPGKVLLPGVVTHSTNIVEHPELVAERIVRLARLVGRENVVASTDCGFAQGPFTRRVHPSIQWAKLASLVQGAEIATRELWGRPARKVA
ncbi:MAG TPA: cobalamin-independent methionine synthase II family protein [Xanthobacteraceae bacterium]|nr:cobalamin-independent methionine synthase II family protein [Xanthobacteraceae bacterium]